AEFHQRSAKYDNGSNHAEADQHSFTWFFIAEISKPHFGIEKVSDQCCKCEQEKGCRDKGNADISKCISGSCLNPWHPSELTRRFYTRAKKHKRGCRTEQDRVDKNGQHLHQSLFYRVRYRSTCGSIWSRSDTGFV